MALIISKDELHRTGTGWKFEGLNFSETKVLNDHRSKINEFNQFKLYLII
jgi:hypothetical protein